MDTAPIDTSRRARFDQQLQSLSDEAAVIVSSQVCFQFAQHRDPLAADSLGDLVGHVGCGCAPTRTEWEGVNL